MSSNPISQVPTNIITGFLGVGKTSTIMSLIEHKPEHERWAVLVNEFGEIGVDGSLFQGQHAEQQVFIREVPGGCMCCAAGLPMEIALNQLLSTAKPDRLLIEPTGLGHPKEVLEVLSSEHYRQVLSLQQTITLVDARKLAEPKYTEHDTFNQQIVIADVIVGNKQDLYRADEAEQLIAYVNQANPDAKVIFAEHGKLPLSALEGKTQGLSNSTHHHHHHHGKPKPLACDLPMPESGLIKASNQGEGYNSVGWRFAPDKVFSRQSLVRLLVNLVVERMKAVFITDMGVFGYNLTPDGITEIELDECFESRIELISQANAAGKSTIDDGMESQLLACLVD
ncbi:GTP-binding protein [Shewanella sp. WXL01]|uniref:CobW family GTP-binding protein n=1 Tax=Shewanella sp. WXL01 TaxID=2709721 RepID=UPI00143836C8|nr:GTP-binding protein [Shewanella sp. WXL01]NKF50274.1 GTP-binding protein [Shewanella sp. WXL01]